MTTTTTAAGDAALAADPALDPAARIGELRVQIDRCDADIIQLIQQRMSISREIGGLRAAAGGTRLSLAREQQILAKFQSELGPDGASLAMMLLRQGRGRL